MFQKSYDLSMFSWIVRPIGGTIRPFVHFKKMSMIYRALYQVQENTELNTMLFLWLKGLVRKTGKETMRPCLKYNNTGEQKENICLIRGHRGHLRVINS